MILSDGEILKLVRDGELVIEPFDPSCLSPNGIDLRLGSQIAKLKPGKSPKESFELIEGEEFRLEPRSQVLVHTLEYVKLPPYLMAFIQLRSTYARLGLTLPPTVVDAGFEGQLTVALTVGEIPVTLKKGDRFLHLIFARLSQPAEKPYRGIYKGQRGVSLPVVR